MTKRRYAKSRPPGEPPLPIIKAVKPLASRYGDEPEPEAIAPVQEPAERSLSLRDPCWMALEAAHALVTERLENDPVYAADEMDWELFGGNIRSKQRRTIGGLEQANNPLRYWSEFRLCYSPGEGLSVRWRRHPTGPGLTNVTFSLHRRDLDRIFPVCVECEEQSPSPTPAPEAVNVKRPSPNERARILPKIVAAFKQIDGTFQTREEGKGLVKTAMVKQGFVSIPWDLLEEARVKSRAKGRVGRPPKGQK
jgi:hypothetical protein